jgi:hypothetical protein
MLATMPIAMPMEMPMTMCMSPPISKTGVLLYITGLLTLLAGFAIKFAATWSGGLDIYFYKVC